jgi:hypothetical protein
MSIKEERDVIEKDLWKVYSMPSEFDKKGNLSENSGLFEVCLRIGGSYEEGGVLFVNGGYESKKLANEGVEKTAKAIRNMIESYMKDSHEYEKRIRKKGVMLK